ncbi:MAG: tetratricopeptide repeat protein [Planctomycetota bacterium]
MRSDTSRRPRADAPRLACVCLLLGALGGCGKTALEYLEESRSAPSVKEEERLLTLALDKDPDLNDARLRRAWVYAMQRQPEEALGDYDALHRKTLAHYARELARYDALDNEKKTEQGRAAILGRRRRELAFILHRRARALELNRRYPEAVSSYTEALQNNPAVLDVYADRARAHFKMGQYAESMRDYLVMLNRDIQRAGDEGLNRRGEWRLLRGSAASCAGEWESAAADFQVAINGLKEPHRKAQAFLGLYVVACRIGSKEDADRVLLSYATETNLRYKGSARANTWIFRAVWHVAGLIDQSRFLDQSKHRNAALSAEQAARAQYYIGARLLVDGAKERAREAFAACVAIDNPALIEYHLAKAELERLVVGGKTAGEYVALAGKAPSRAKGIELLTRALAVNPNHADARRSRGILYSLSGQYDRAIDDFTRLLAVCKRPIEQGAALRYRAFARARNGDHLAAVADYEAAIKADPKLWRAREGLAGSLCALRRYDEAAAAYSALMEPVGWDDLGPFWHRERALALTCAGKWKEAADDFRILLKNEEPAIVCINLYIVECKLGDAAGAAKRLKAHVDELKQADWPSSAARYVAGQLDKKVFLKLSEHSDDAVQARRVSQAYYYIGAVDLIRGDKAKAREAFAKCVDMGRAASQESWEFRMALAERGRHSNWR